MKFAIVDDMAADREQLVHDLGIWAEDHNISLVPLPTQFSNGEELMSVFSAGMYDVIFLDVYMNGINGIDLARHIRETDQSCCIVFITYSVEFAVDSYEVEASYYLLKPYTQAKLEAALERCGVSNLERMQYITIPKTQERLFLHTIAYTEYAGRQVHVHFRNGTEAAVAMSHTEFARMVLEYPYFCDCVRGILVNFEAVDKLTAGSFVLRGGQRIPISRLKYPAVKKSFLDFSYAKMREWGDTSHAPESLFHHHQ